MTSVLTCERLQMLPSGYYEKLPFSKYRANKIIRSTKCRKRQFHSDEHFQSFLKKEHIKSYFPMILEGCRNNADLAYDLMVELLKISFEKQSSEEEEEKKKE